MMNYKKIIALYGMDAFKKHYEANKSNWIIASDYGATGWSPEFEQIVKLNHPEKIVMGKRSFKYTSSYSYTIYSIKDNTIIYSRLKYNTWNGDTTGSLYLYNPKNDIMILFNERVRGRFDLNDVVIKAFLNYIIDNAPAEFNENLEFKL